jgi:hypothetical protein
VAHDVASDLSGTAAPQLAQRTVVAGPVFWLFVVIIPAS